MKRELSFKVSAGEEGQRLDSYLAGKTEDLSRSFLQGLIKGGQVLVDGQKRKQSHRLQGAEEIEVRIPPPENPQLEPEAIPLNIIYEDQDLLVLNKEPGMVVHPAPGHSRGTLVHALLAHCKNLSGISGVRRPGIVHRLDKDTSGAMVVAKGDGIHQQLVEQFKERQVRKVYLALVEGQFPHQEGRIEAPIGRHPEKRKRMTVTAENSREAVTCFKIRERLSAHTLLELELKTGRMHQIRVHTSYLGHPVAGDRVYSPPRAARKYGRQLLHSWRLGFTHPGLDKWMDFEAELPADICRVLEDLRNN